MQDIQPQTTRVDLTWMRLQNGEYVIIKVQAVDTLTPDERDLLPLLLDAQEARKRELDCEMRMSAILTAAAKSAGLLVQAGHGPTLKEAQRMRARCRKCKKARC